MAKLLIVEDDESVRMFVSRALERAGHQIHVAADGAQGLDMICAADSDYDLVVSDIRMPEMDGIEAAKALAGQAHVVFVTAYDEYAVNAFEQGAVDYLLKPADPERVATTCQRLRARIERKPDAMEELLAQLSQRLPGGAAKSREYLRWVQASVGATLRVIPTTDILFFRAEDKYTRVQTAGFEALIRKTIKELAEELDPAEFWQIHRAIVIRVDAVEQVGRDFRGRQVVKMKGRDEKLEVSRSFSHLFKQM